jgi:hypothetical protein
MLAKNALQSTTSTISSTMATQKALVLPEKYGGFVVDSAVPIRKFGLDLVQSYPVTGGCQRRNRRHQLSEQVPSTGVTYSGICVR